MNVLGLAGTPPADGSGGECEETEHAPGAAAITKEPSQPIDADSPQEAARRADPEWCPL